MKLLGAGPPRAGSALLPLPCGVHPGRRFFSDLTEKNSRPVSKSQAVGFLIPRNLRANCSERDSNPHGLFNQGILSP